MATAIQKILLITILLGSHQFSVASNTTLQVCGRGALSVAQKHIGTAIYYAENCQQSWQTQSIAIDFNYQHAIPEWAFKRAAGYFLQRNIQQQTLLDIFNQVTALYRPVKPGDHYRLRYEIQNKTLTLSLNQRMLGSIQHPEAQKYFSIWFGAQPFNVKLKQQLLDLN
ncbi:MULTISPECIES: chalcone isomerase family protein [unclassified Acinetobacter]|uniref:chalcone isomerase family protein n=1 Tax=unclassified Acinetobacter TaxID=196816 RepID=UPI002934843D|nr:MULTISPECIES: chalcone isomerase family protein [unclassified Acinetobacter]WOE32427.1 chalcone isomerase family protein [Acinetobacter sp. SAAs470]WOE37901.1 chalcone isomerase family protein [Acinetobacter sp. SAAs474]